ncbi:hypothetical protein N9Y42_04805 [Mariniblastus sp.]|nr:hypothetical protein [Mariniblastus sp.]
MKLPASITIVECNSYFDGGTVEFVVTGEAGESLRITINQHAFSVSHPRLYRWLGRFAPSNRKPGRLLVNRSVVPPRSDQENKIVRLLATAKISVVALDGWDTRETNRLREECLEYIQSETYLEIARTGIVPAHHLES